MSGSSAVLARLNIVSISMIFRNGNVVNFSFSYRYMHRNREITRIKREEIKRLKDYLTVLQQRLERYYSFKKFELTIGSHIFSDSLKSFILNLLWVTYNSGSNHSGLIFCLSSLVLNFVRN